MFTGYLALGGVEIANTDRAIGYSRSASCPIFWLRNTETCQTVQTALGDAEYTIENIEDAPWYDPTNADVSSRFYGVVIIDVKGLSDPIREVARYEGILDGGVLGASRKGMKSARF